MKRWVWIAIWIAAFLGIAFGTLLIRVNMAVVGLVIACALQATVSWPPLSKREENILSLTMAGLADKEIAASLGLSIHTVRTYWERIRGSVGKETRAEVIAEVSRRRSQELALSEVGNRISEANAKRAELEDILGRTPVAVWATSPDGTLRYVNDWFKEYAGCTSKDEVAKTWDDILPKLLPAEMLRGIRAEAEAAQVQGGTFDHEFPIRRHDGEFRWHLVREVPILNEAGEVIRRVGAATDIEEIHNRERTAAARESSLRMIADMAERGIAYSEPTSQNYYSNAAYEALTGSVASRVSWTEAVHPDDRAHVSELWAHALHSGKELRSEHRYLHSDGTVTRASVRALATAKGGWVLLASKVAEGGGMEPANDHLSRLAVVLTDILGLHRDQAK